MIEPSDTKPLDGLEEALLWTSWKRDHQQSVRAKLFSHHTGFARNIARRHHREQSRGDLDLADLYQHAYAGLLEALDRFDPDRGVPFRPFAAHRISGSVRDGIARSSEIREQISWRHRVRRERLQSLSGGTDESLDTMQALEKLSQIAVGLALGFMLEGTGLFVTGSEAEDIPDIGRTAYESTAWQEMVTHLQSELAELPEREQAILRQHYLGGVDFDRLAGLLSLSKGRVSQIHRAALLLLRKRLRERGHFRVGG